MINIGNSSIENILVGDTQVDRVYLGTDIVWEYQQPSVKNYLKFTALESGTFTLTIPAAVNTSYITSISYSLDNGATWVTTQNSSSAITITTPTVAQGDSVLWKGTGTAFAKDLSTYSNFSSSGSFQASGNSMSLLYEDTFENETSLAKTYCFTRLFYQCTGLTTAPELPATTITNYCYQEMFRGTSIVIAPELPATTANEGCYQSMFSQCPSLTDAPSELPATTLQYRCYQSMFYECSSLVNTPAVLPAETVNNASYYQMFIRCTSLINAPEIQASATASPYSCVRMFQGCSSLNTVKCLITTLVSGSTSNWLDGVAANGTFIKAANMTSWPSGKNGIPSGWTVVDYNS